MFSYKKGERTHKEWYKKGKKNWEKKQFLATAQKKGFEASDAVEY